MQILYFPFLKGFGQAHLNTDKKKTGELLEKWKLC
jgi:hypothetical protein